MTEQGAQLIYGMLAMVVFLGICGFITAGLIKMGKSKPRPYVAPRKDNCQVCHGAKGGVLGNGQWVDGVLMCDYCHASHGVYKSLVYRKPE